MEFKQPQFVCNSIGETIEATVEGKVEETVGTTTVEEARNETFTEERESPRLVTL